MNRPPMEVADIIRAAGENFIEKQRSWLTGFTGKCCPQSNVAGQRLSAGTATVAPDAVTRLRPSHITHAAIAIAQSASTTPAKDGWRRGKELLPVQYVHLVFTVPHALVPLFLHNKKLLYALLLRSSAATLLEVARNPEHLGAEIGFFSVLHTWGQNLLAHPHVHCVIPAGGLSPDHKTWIQPRYRFFLPKGVLSLVFRGKFVAGLKRLSARESFASRVICGYSRTRKSSALS